MGLGSGFGKQRSPDLVLCGHAKGPVSTIGGDLAAARTPIYPKTGYLWGQPRPSAPRVVTSRLNRVTALHSPQSGPASLDTAFQSVVRFIEVPLARRSVA